MSLPSLPLTHEKGRLLEVATQLYFEAEKPVEAIYTWSDWAVHNGLPLQDTGIDLVALIQNEAWGIQCKNWAREVDWNDLGTFVGSLSTQGFRGGYLVAKSLSQTAEKKLAALEKDVLIIPTQEIAQSYFEQAEALLRGKPLRAKAPKTLRPYQEEALEKVLEGFRMHRRGQLLMPPGTGKTLVSLRIAESLLETQLAGDAQSPLVLFLCPSIALVDQSLKVWLRERRYGMHVAAVVSDKSVGKADELHHRSLLSFPATTQAKELLTKFSLRPGHLNVIFATYQSLEVVVEAQKEGFPEIDLSLIHI